MSLDLDKILNSNDSREDVEELAGQSAGAFAATVAGSVAIFAVQAGLFILIKDRLSRIYQPRTYLVPKRQRTASPPRGWVKWTISVLRTTNSEFVEKCGLDAYFFLRYLRTLLKIFLPAACIILPILAPLNAIDGRGTAFAEEEGGGSLPVMGLDQLAWPNVRPTNTDRFWAHWLLALSLIIYVCAVVFGEFRSYIRMRQAYLTSPQHRLRASATTVLVSSIPRKWCTVQALDGLYDVFPGGIRNIWLNRNYDALTDKVKLRDKMAKKLEAAETNLIKACVKAAENKSAHQKQKDGNMPSKSEKQELDAEKDARGARIATQDGLSSGAPQQIPRSSENPSPNASTSALDRPGVDQQAAHQRATSIAPFQRKATQALGRDGEMGKQEHLGGELNQFPAGPARPADGNSWRLSIFSSLRSPQPYTGSEGGWKRSDLGRGDDDDRQALAQGSPDSAHLPSRHKPGRRQYPDAFNPGREGDDADAVWRKYVGEKDRETMRLPIFGWQWMFPIPLIGKKVDKIYHCRKEVARLNTEIEEDQQHPEQFPQLNSAFIQFNHQAAAHMACQSISHHLPKQMAPRLVEIDPYDVIWDNMSLPWWQMYLRTAVVILFVAAMVILWVLPVAVTSFISQISTLVKLFDFLAFIRTLPQWLRSGIQGILPPAMLALLLVLLPFILRLLSKWQGNQSGMMIELSVQKYYFFFLFVQLFLVVSVAAAAPTVFGLFQQGADAVVSIPEILADNVPNASTYFFSYMLLQALTVSAGALVQIAQLLKWFVLGPMLDSTARSKFRRQVKLPEVKWGKFFPVYTNLACIGLIYSVISPLILVFNVITFSLFWFVYRYNSLYVTRFTRDTGGLLYPTALNFTFVGVYVMEIVLIGLFFLVRDDEGRVACYGQGVGMVVILALTLIFQIVLNEAFGPLFRYLPITLEDEAVQRDEEFARMVRRRHGLPEQGQSADGQKTSGEPDEVERRGSWQDEAQLADLQIDKPDGDEAWDEDGPGSPKYVQNEQIRAQFDRPGRASRFFHRTNEATSAAAERIPLPMPSSQKRATWADRARNHRSVALRQSLYGQLSPGSDSTAEGSGRRGPDVRSGGGEVESAQQRRQQQQQQPPASPSSRPLPPPPPQIQIGAAENLTPVLARGEDIEAQRQKQRQVAGALFDGFNEDLEDLTPEQRDFLVQRAFKHTAMRARRPAIWIPRDELGVSDDEVRQTAALSEKIWISNVRQGLDAKRRCVYSGTPPDFTELDIIRL